MSLLQKLSCKKEVAFLSMIVTAAGSASRMGYDKIFAEIDGVPVLAHTLRAIEACPEVHEIIVVVRKNQVGEAADMCREFGVTKAAKIVHGGARRIDSVRSGVMEASRRADLIAIHDGARPLVTNELIRRTARCALQFGAAVPAVPVQDTVKRGVDGVVTETLDRSSLFLVQTPQIFEASMIKAALEQMAMRQEESFDDAMAVEAMGLPVHLAEGAYDNIKITTPPDIWTVKSILDSRAETERAV